MKKNPRIRPFILGLAALLFVPACSHHVPEALAADQIPGAIKQAFSQATGETKEVAALSAAACQKQDAVAAFTNLQALARQKDLTPEERSVTSRAEITCLKQVRTAADQGDASAQSVLQQYLSTR